MMYSRYNYSLGIVFLFLLASCTEKGPAIDFSKTIASDTTYVITPESPTLRRVLIEEYTGVQCTNCPAGVEILKSVDNQHLIINGADTLRRLIIIGYHYGALTAPMSNSTYDFRSDKAGDLLGSYFSEDPNKPAISIDRKKEGSNYFIEGRNQWPNLINARVSIVSPVNLTLHGNYDPVDRKITVMARASYTQAVSGSQSLTVALTENNIADLQKYPDTIKMYEHNHVFRDFLTPISGDLILNSLETKEPGRVYERTFIYTLPEDADWNPEYFSVVAFIHKTIEKEVEQAAEIKLVP